MGSSEQPASKTAYCFGMIESRGSRVLAVLGISGVPIPLDERLLVMEVRRMLLGDDAEPSTSVPKRSVDDWLIGPFSFHAADGIHSLNDKCS